MVASNRLVFELYSHLHLINIFCSRQPKTWLFLPIFRLFWPNNIGKKENTSESTNFKLAILTKNIYGEVFPNCMDATKVYFWLLFGLMVLALYRVCIWNIATRGSVKHAIPSTSARYIMGSSLVSNSYGITLNVWKVKD